MSCGNAYSQARRWVTRAKGKHVMNARPLLLGFLCGLLVLGSAGSGIAQDPPAIAVDPDGGPVPRPPDAREAARRPGAPGKGGERNRELFEQVLVARLSSELKLTDEQTVLMVRRYFDFKEENRRLRRDRAELLRSLRELVKKTPSDEAAIDAKLAELMRADDMIASLKRSFYDKLAEGLDAERRAKLYVFLQELEGELKRFAEELRERRPGAGPPPPGEMRRGEGPPRRMEGRPAARGEGPGPKTTPTDQLPAPPPTGE